MARVRRVAWLAVLLLLVGTVVPTSAQNRQAAPPPGATASGAHDNISAFNHTDIDSKLCGVIDELLTSALSSNVDCTDLDRAVEKYSTNIQKGRSNAKDVAINYIGLPRGFDYSQEGARLALDQEQDVKSLEAAQYARQQRIDRVHEELVTAVLQIADGFGDRDLQNAKQNILSGQRVLEYMCGTKNAAEMLQLVSETASMRVDGELFDQPCLTLVQMHGLSETALRLAMQQDLSVLRIRERLASYSDHTKAKQISGKFIEGTVTAVTILGPGIGVPIAAQAAGAAWGLANGGSEESKLLKELYYEKQLESRRHTIESEAQLALLSHDRAVRTHNAPLLICSEAVLAQLVGAIGMQQLVNHSVIDHGIFVAKTIAGPDSKASLTIKIQRKE